MFASLLTARASAVLISFGLSFGSLLYTPKAFAAGTSVAGASDGGAPDGGAAAASASDAGVPAMVEGGPHTGTGATAAATADGKTTDTGAGLFEQGLSQSQNIVPTDGAAKDSARAAEPRPFTMTGYVRGDAFVGKVPGYRTGGMKAAYGELSLAVKTAQQRYGDSSGAGFAEVRVRQGLQGDEQQTFVDLREAYANAYVGPVDLRFGRQIIVWGRADVLNPTNNLTPFDLRIRSPIEDDRRIGNVGARLFVTHAPVRVEGVWMPLFAPSGLPAVGLPEFVTFGAPRFPPPEIKNGLLAGRIHLELPAFEMSVSYLHGYAPLPGFTLSGLTFDPVSPEVRVSRTAYDHQVVGLDFSTALGEIVALRGEAAYRRPFDYRSRIYAPRPDLQYVLGVDRAFGSVNVIAQYVGRYVFDWRKENGPDQPLDPSILMVTPSPFLEGAATTAINLQLARTNQILFSQTARVQHLASARVEWLTLHDTLSIAALGVVNVTTREWLASPKIGYRMTDALTAYLGAEIFMGPDGTLFGLIDQVLSAGYTEVRLSF